MSKFNKIVAVGFSVIAATAFALPISSADTETTAKTYVEIQSQSEAFYNTNSGNNVYLVRDMPAPK